MKSGIESEAIVESLDWVTNWRPHAAPIFLMSVCMYSVLTGQTSLAGVSVADKETIMLHDIVHSETYSKLSMRCCKPTVWKLEESLKRSVSTLSMSSAGL